MTKINANYLFPTTTVCSVNMVSTKSLQDFITSSEEYNKILISLLSFFNFLLHPLCDVRTVHYVEFIHFNH